MWVVAEEPAMFGVPKGMISHSLTGPCGPQAMLLRDFFGC